MASEPLALDDTVDARPRRLSENGRLLGIGVYGLLVVVGFFIGIVTGYEKARPVIVVKKETTKVAEVKSEKPKTTSSKQQPAETRLEEAKPEVSKPEEPKPVVTKPEVAKPDEPKPKPAEPPKPPSPPTPAKLVELLGSADEAERGKAEVALRAMGKTAEGVLREGSKSPVPTVAKKSKELLVAIVGEPKKEEPKKEIAKAISFKEVSAILQRNCANCHGAAGKPRDDVDVSSYDKLMKSPSGIGKAIVPGDPKKSGVLAAIVGGSMPPEGKPKPSESEITLLRNWILGGAKPRRRRRVVVAD